MSAAGTQELIRAAQAGESEACAQLIEENQGLIWSIVRRFYGRGVEPDDLYQLACIGVVKAVNGFDDRYGTQFSTYAVPKIIGEIRRYLRDDGIIKVSRTIKEDAREIRQAREALETELGREPSLGEIAQRISMSCEDIAAAELSLLPPDSLQRETGDEGLRLDGLIGDGSTEETIVESLALREMLDTLSDRERLVLTLRYYRNLTQQQTAALAGVSQVQVSRIERRALERLRRRMQV